MFTENQMFTMIMAFLLSSTIWGLKIIFNDIRKGINDNKEKHIDVDKKFVFVDKRLDNHDVTIGQIITAHNGAKCDKTITIDPLSK